MFGLNFFLSLHRVEDYQDALCQILAFYTQINGGKFVS